MSIAQKFNPEFNWKMWYSVNGAIKYGTPTEEEIPLMTDEARDYYWSLVREYDEPVAYEGNNEWDVITPEEMAQEAAYWAQRQVEADAQHEADKKFLALVDSMPENDCGL